MGSLTLTGLKPGETTITFKAGGGATASVPVRVRERNLIAYGPAVQHGLTFTIDPDGGLHVAGSIAGWLMVQWQMDPTGLAGRTLTLTPGMFPKRFDCYIAMIDSAGAVTRKAGTFTAPDDLASIGFVFRHTNTATDTDSVDATIRPMLNLGGTAFDWERPATVDAPTISTYGDEPAPLTLEGPTND